MSNGQTDNQDVTSECQDANKVDSVEVTIRCENCRSRVIYPPTGSFSIFPLENVFAVYAD